MVRSDTDRVEELRFAVAGDIVCHFEVAIGAGTLGVNDALWDPLTVEVCKLVDQVEVFQQDRSVLTNRQRVNWLLFEAKSVDLIIWIIAWTDNGRSANRNSEMLRKH